MGKPLEVSTRFVELSYVSAVIIVAIGSISENIKALRSFAFTLRCIADVLEAEKKPLFGAFNTRQKDCISALARLAAVIPFNCSPEALRALIIELLTPLLINAEQVKSKRSALSPNSR